MNGVYNMERCASQIYDWRPGNSTKYKLIVTEDGEKLYLTWYRFASSGVCMIINKGPGAFAHHSYLEKKFNCSQGDSAPILAFLNELYDIPVGMPPGFNSKGIYTGVEASG